MKPFSPLKPIFLASIFILSLTNISDPDAFTHLSLGREIIKNLGFPLTEPFNYTAIDKPFAYPEWLFGVVLYAIYAIFGSSGVVIFKAGIVTLAYFVLFKDSMTQSKIEGLESRVNDPRPLLAVALLFIVALFARGRFVERPEILSNLFLAFTIFSLNQFFYNGKRYIYFVPIIFIIWANSHPSVIIGLYPFAAFIIGGSIYAFLNKSDLNQWKRIKIIILLLFISIFCAMVNPYTYSIFIAPKGLSENIWRYMTAELAPPYWERYMFLYIFIGILLVSFLFNIRQSIIHIILVLPFIALSTNAIRFIPLIGIVGAPIAAKNFSTFVSRLTTRGLRSPTVITAFVSTSMIVLTLAAIFNIGPFKNYGRQFGLSIDAQSLPEGALEYLDKNNIHGRIFNTFHFGGYITFKEHPKRLTFIDGRGGAFLDYLNAFDGQKAWERIEKKYDVDIAILEYPQAPSLLADVEGDFLFSYKFSYKGWTLVYWDSASMVYLKDEVFKDIVERDGYRYIKPADDMQQFNNMLYNKELQNNIIRELNRNIKINPNPRAYFLLGFAYNVIGEFDNAVESMNKVFDYKGAAASLFSSAHSEIGFSYLKKGDIKEALAHYKKAVKYVYDPDTLYNIGVVYLQVNDYKNAVYYLKKAIAVKDNHLPAYTALIGIYRKLGYEDELEAIEKRYRQKDGENRNKGHFKEKRDIYRFH